MDSDQLRDDALSKQDIPTVARRLAEIEHLTLIIDSYVSDANLDTGGEITQSMNKIRRNTEMIEDALGLTAARKLIDEITALLDEHPDGWEGPCMCKECLAAEG